MLREVISDDILCLFIEGWLTENPNWKMDADGKEARCSVCLINLRAHHDGLIKHANTKRHKDKMKNVNKNVQRSIENLSKSTLYMYIGYVYIYT